MPSWNIHTAHVERLLEGRVPEELGVADVNAFLFGNYVPDIYVGFMVPDASFHIDYCLTHMAEVNIIPVPDAERFWDDFIYHRRPKTDVGLSLVLGAWAHLVADQTYNRCFREFCETHEVPDGEARRKGKQGDFALFGHSLSISWCVESTPELVEAARRFLPYSILREDVEKSIVAANSIVRENAQATADGEYLLLGADWMIETFNACNERLVSWLEAWQRLEQRGEKAPAAAICAEI